SHARLSPALLSYLCSARCASVFFLNDTATTEIYTLSLHDALPILVPFLGVIEFRIDIEHDAAKRKQAVANHLTDLELGVARRRRSEEHTSELQSLTNLVCRLLLEKKKITSMLDHRSASLRDLLTCC